MAAKPKQSHVHTSTHRQTGRDELTILLGMIDAIAVSEQTPDRQTDTQTDKQTDT